MEFKAEIKKTFTGPDKLRAVCSVVLDDCFLVKNVACLVLPSISVFST